MPRGPHAARLLSMRRRVRLAPSVPLVCSGVHFKKSSEFAVGNTDFGRVQRHRAATICIRQAEPLMSSERTGGKSVGYTGRRAGASRRMRTRQNDKFCREPLVRQVLASGRVLATSTSGQELVRCRVARVRI
jgi:hypothetical protein